MSKADLSSEEEDDYEFETNVHNARYTLEQKIVTAVWVHERQFNKQTLQDVKNNFRIRFKMPPPKNKTIKAWENQLFSEGSFSKNRSRRPLQRLMHVPYVKASFREKPDLSITERANQLGLSRGLLLLIMKYDLKETDMNKQEIASDASKKQDSVNSSSDKD